MTENTELPEGVQPEDVDITRLWIVFGAVVYLGLSATGIAVDRYVLTPISIFDDQVLRTVLLTINLVISALAGGFLEYSRARIKLMKELPNGDIQ